MKGSLPPARVPRVAAAARLDAPLTACLRFALDEAGTPVVEVEVQGCYGFTCQRCLQPMQERRHDRSRVLVAADEAGFQMLEAQGEVLMCARGDRLDLAALVEDEVLLALPLAPGHPRGDCGGEPAHRAGSGEAPGGTDDRENPFAVLAALKRDPDGAP